MPAVIAEGGRVVYGRGVRREAHRHVAQTVQLIAGQHTGL